MSVTVLLLLLANLVMVTHAVDISYSDIVATNKTCRLKDSCRQGKTSRVSDVQDWRVRNCFCDDICRMYGDCCVDANAFSAEEQRSGILKFRCVALRNLGGVYMKTSCPEDWKDNSIKEMCERDLFMTEDPFGHTPVTNPKTGLTYGNYYCAVCNGDSSGLVFWRPRIECPALTSYSRQYRNITPEWIASRLEYEQDRKEWKVRVDIGGVDVLQECFIDPVFPETVQHYIRRCKEATRVCVDNWTDTVVKEKCEAYTAYIYSSVETFRNVHCAMCNLIELDALFCFERVVLGRGTFNRDFNPVSFSVLFDMNNLHGDGNMVGLSTKCKEGEIYDPFFKKCRNVVCGREDKVYRQGRCIDWESSQKETISKDSKTRITGDETSTSVNTTSVDLTSDAREIGNDTADGTGQKQNGSISDNSTSSAVRPQESGEDLSHLGHADHGELHNGTTVQKQDLTENANSSFQSCPKFSLNQSEYQVLGNDTMYVPQYQRTFIPGQYMLIDSVLIICAVGIPAAEKFSGYMGHITSIFLCISIVCLFLHLIAFVMVSDLQNLSGKNLASLSAALLVTYSTFLIAQFTSVATVRCTVIAVIMYYFILASFFWMLIMAFDVWRTLRLATSLLRISAGKQWKRFIVYFTVGWFVPAAVVGVAVVIENLAPNTIPSYFRPHFGKHVCWFSQRTALLAFFAAPVIIIMLINLILFIFSAKMIVVTTKNTTKANDMTPQQNFKMYFRLALLMGLTWIIGLIAAYVEVDIVWYLFIFFNTLQGFFIFVFFTCSRKVMKTLREKIYYCCWTADSSGTSKSNLESRISSESRSSQTSQNSLTTSRCSIATTDTLF